MIRVAIVEDNAAARDFVAGLIAGADEMVHVGSFASAEEAITGIPPLAPDVILMDISLPSLSGIDCTQRLKQRLPGVQIIMLTSSEDPSRVFESLKAGATGYVIKRASDAEIVGAVRDVMAGGAPMSPAIARKVVQFFGRQDPAPEISRLSAREVEVLEALSGGRQYKEIADWLSISINTVRNHIRGIYEKLHVNTREDAIRKLGRN